MLVKISKNILKSPLVIWLGALLVAWWIRFVYLTTRWQVINPDIPVLVEKEHNNSVVVAFWHGRLMMIPPFRPEKFKANVVISNSRDGEIIAQVQKRFGMKSVRGSSGKEDRKDKGGFSAALALMQVKQRGEVVVITPDGPRGPARKVSNNTLKMLKKLEMPIIPVTYSTCKHRQMRSWDKFMLAMPFSRGVFIYGQPILPGEVDKLEQALNDITDQADKLTGFSN